MKDKLLGIAVIILFLVASSYDYQEQLKDEQLFNDVTTMIWRM